MTAITLADIARRAKCSLPTAAQAASYLCLRVVGSRQTAHARSVYLYAPSCVELVKVYLKAPRRWPHMHGDVSEYRDGKNL